MYEASITGNVGRTPEIRYLDSGQTVTDVSLAVRQFKKDAPARWIKVTLWGKKAELAANALTKGDLVFFSGRVETPELFTKRDGTQGLAEKFTANNLEFLGAKKTLANTVAEVVSDAATEVCPMPTERPAAQPATQSATNWQSSPVVPDSDEIPF